MLTDTKIRQAKAKTKPYKLGDQDGLYLYVSKKGAKSWRYDYRIDGKHPTITYGRYPGISLEDARDLHRAARRLVAKGESPAKRKQDQKAAKRVAAANTVKALGEAWYSDLVKHRSESWKNNSRRWLDDICDDIGTRPIASVTHPEVTALVKRIAAKRGARSAHCARQLLGNVFEFAQAHGIPVENHARAAVKAVTPPEPKSRAPLSQKDLPAFVEVADAYCGRLQTKLAIKLLLLTFVRKAELLDATWDEIDLKRAQWRIPAERMKMKEAHIVFLSTQSLAAFRDLKEVSCGSRYVLPNFGDLRRPMGHSTLNKAFDAMGYGGRFTPHGLRATASTLLNEHGFRSDVIERQLAHTERNRVRAAYNHAEYLEERRAMMQQWADYIDGLCGGADVIALRRSAA